MRARSQVSPWLSRPRIKAARVALAAGSLAGLAVLGACSESPVVSRVEAPAGIPAPRFGIVGGDSHKVSVCVDPTSDPGPGPGGAYSFTVAAMNPNLVPFPWYELMTSSDPDLSGSGITQNSMGPGWHKNQGNSTVLLLPFFGPVVGGVNTGPLTWRAQVKKKATAHDKLAYQYIAAKLSVGGGTPPAAVAQALLDAEAFFTNRPQGTGTPPAGVASILDDFVNGNYAGWPHC